MNQNSELFNEIFIEIERAYVAQTDRQLPEAVKSLAQINSSEIITQAINTATSPLVERIEELTRQKNGAYFERNQCVAALVKQAIALGYKAGRAVHPKEDTAWEDDWRHMVFIDLPTGQISWHFHDTEAYLLDNLPWYDGAWDGHDTPEKYRRVNSIEPTNNLESTILLLSEALKTTISELVPINPFNCHDDEYEFLNEKVMANRVKLKEALSTSQPAINEIRQRLRESVIDEAVGVLDHTPPWGMEEHHHWKERFVEKLLKLKKKEG